MAPTDIASRLSIGPLTITSPVILAPMAGVTNVAFRRLCREIGLDMAGVTAGLYVCEMITARALVMGNEKTRHMAQFHESESPRSLQLYTSDLEYTRRAAEMIRREDLADHIDMNFGCPVPKVTRRGGGAALPYKRALFRQVVAAAVEGAGGIPVTVKTRIGIDAEHETFLESAQIAEEEGVQAITLHARTAAQRYSGHSDWSAITQLKEAVNIPVIGNGDIFTAADALAMFAETGCDGIEVGRGCLGRPWLFAQIARALAEDTIPAEPTLGVVTEIILRHGELLTEFMGEQQAMRDIRKHVGWYLHGYPVGGKFRAQLGSVDTQEHLRQLLELWADSEALPQVATGPRGRQGSVGTVHLPEGWLDDPDEIPSTSGLDPDHIY
ncbi:MAG: tRNA dihydrouridine synthase DusB [Corynebacterium sp.]|nr:tRNA dihydrouridine synthase DusB [Corynebacterium sp.]